MITLTWADIRNPVFVGILQRMINSPMPFEVSVKLLTLAKKVNDERTLSNVMFAKLEKEYTEVVKVEGQPDNRRFKEGMAVKGSEEFAKASNHKFSVRLSPIKSILLQGVVLTVNELLAIKPLIEDADDLGLEEAAYDEHEQKKAESKGAEESHAQAEVSP